MQFAFMVARVIYYNWPKRYWQF